MNYIKYRAAIYGNLATSLWFFPYLSKLLHSIRGVNFKDRRSVFIGREVSALICRFQLAGPHRLSFRIERV